MSKGDIFNPNSILTSHSIFYNDPINLRYNHVNAKKALEVMKELQGPSINERYEKSPPIEVSIIHESYD